MSAVTPLTNKNASPEAADIFAGIEQKFGMVPNIFRVMGHHPDVLSSFLKPFEAIQSDTCVATISFPGWRQLEVPVDDCVAWALAAVLAQRQLEFPGCG